MTKKHIAAIILAAGKGRRMQLADQNKVTAPLGGKPIITHIVHFMKQIGIKDVVVVIGHEKESVMKTLKDEDVLFADQETPFGTGHAVLAALSVLPSHITDVLVVYGDDAVLYNEKSIPSIEKVFAVHADLHPAVTFLTIEQKNPFGLGRILRNIDGKAIGIREEKDATESEKQITEINPGCFLFNVQFLRQYLPKVEKSPVTGEYYLTSVIDLVFEAGEQIETVRGGYLPWRGVNTPDELLEAEKLIANSL